MSVLKMNLRSGVSSLASFVGIGQGMGKLKAKTEPRFAGIGAGAHRAAEDDDDPEMRRGRRARRAQGNDPDPDDDGDGAGDNDDDGDGSGNDGGDSGDDENPTQPDDQGDDDDALEDDDFGADAPNDDDSPEEAEAKRARRVARRARRVASEKRGSTRRGRRADAEDGDGGEEEDPASEMAGRSPLAQARRRERARCMAIFAHAAAKANPDLAGHLAFNTSLPRGQAIAALKHGGAAGRGQLAGAMAGYAGQRPGAPPVEKTRAQAAVEGWDHAFDAVTAYRNNKR